MAEWQPIATAPKDGLPIRLFCEGFINPDFNPGGSVEGQWCDDLGWVGAVWNPEQDYWDTNQIVPTHWQPLPPPPAGVQPSDEWAEAKRVRDLPAVDDAIRNFLIDSTGDNSTCMVREVLRAAGVALPREPKENDRG